MEKNKLNIFNMNLK